MKDSSGEAVGLTLCDSMLLREAARLKEGDIVAVELALIQALAEGLKDPRSVAEACETVPLRLGCEDCEVLAVDEGEREGVGLPLGL